MEKWQIEISEFAEAELAAECKYFKEHYSEKYAAAFWQNFYLQVSSILPNPLKHAECRFLPTKKKIYRNIVWGNYLIVFRIKSFRIQVLTLFHTKQHTGKLKQTRRR